jgi:hypothetical protein
VNKPICQKCSKTLDEWDETLLCPTCKASAATTARQHRMIRLEKGDYLLPSNDAQILWRIAQYDEDDGTKLWDSGVGTAGCRPSIRSPPR